jgi:cytochrome c peroxidase
MIATRITFVLVCIALTACGKKEEKAAEEKAPEVETAEAPRSPFEPLPEVKVDEKKVELGRRLYFDTRLSGDGTLSCASCHSFDKGGADAAKTSTGIRGQLGPINSPTVLNAHLNFVQFWDGRAKDLEEQALGPVENPLEMGTTWPEVVERLKADAKYVETFGDLYDDGITKENVANAIAEFERSLSTPAPFDRFLQGDEDAISEEAKRGHDLFVSIGCTSCHTGPGLGGTMFQKFGLLEDYFPIRGGELTEADLGRFNVTKNEADKHMFKVPLLRNVALTAPYFHDGSVDELATAVEIMARVQLRKTLKPDEIEAIVAFLESLTGELPPHAKPPEEDEAAPNEG